ncbi:MAG: rod shape-determining protein RodA [Bacteroidota bacterium]
MFEKPSIRVQLDWLTVGLYSFLVLVGWATVFSSVYDVGGESTFQFQSFGEAMQSVYVKQIVWIALAAILAWVVLSVDAYFIAQTSYLTYGIMIFLLIMVLIVGKEVKGAKAWFDLGVVQLQPAEFAKFATALAIARFLGNDQVKLMRPFNLGVVVLLLIVPMYLIILENETGSMLVFLAFTIALYREGLPHLIMIIGLSAVVLLIGTLLSLDNIWVLIRQLVYFWILFAVIMSLNGYLKLRPDYRPPAFVPALEVGVLLLGGILFWYFLSDAVDPVSSEGGSYKVPPFFKIEDFQAAFQLLMLPLVVLLLVAIGLTAAYKKTYSRFIWVFFFAGLSIGTVVGLDFFVKGILKPHQQTRLQVLINPDADTQGAGYHVAQSKIAIGSGGWTGKGYLDGRFTKLRYVPDRHTDFIFCTFAEEWGWIGSTFLLTVFGALLWRLIIVAERQRSRFSRVYGYCVFSIFLFHFLVNIGMTIGVMPVIGIPLPFFSYGGSSLFSFTILLFILLKLDIFRTQRLLNG